MLLHTVTNTLHYTFTIIVAVVRCGIDVDYRVPEHKYSDIVVRNYGAAVQPRKKQAKNGSKQLKILGAGGRKPPSGNLPLPCA